MIYRVTMEMTEPDLKRLGKYERIIPIYRSKANGNDIEFIKAHFFDGVGVGDMYTMYCNEFAEYKILSKKEFGSLVCSVTGCRKARKFKSGSGTKWIYKE